MVSGSFSLHFEKPLHISDINLLFVNYNNVWHENQFLKISILNYWKIQAHCFSCICHVCVYAFSCVCVCRCLKSIRSWCVQNLLLFFDLMLWGRVSKSHPELLIWLVSFIGKLAPGIPTLPSVAGITGRPPCPPRIYVGEMNSSPLACMARV